MEILGQAVRFFEIKQKNPRCKPVMDDKKGSGIPDEKECDEMTEAEQIEFARQNLKGSRKRLKNKLPHPQDERKAFTNDPRKAMQGK